MVRTRALIPGSVLQLGDSDHRHELSPPRRPTRAPPGRGLLRSEPRPCGPPLALRRRSSGFPHRTQGLGPSLLPPGPSLQLGSLQPKIGKEVNRGVATGKWLLLTWRYPLRSNSGRAPERGPWRGPRLADTGIWGCACTHPDVSDSPMAGPLPGARSSNSSGLGPLPAERRVWDRGQVCGRHPTTNSQAGRGRLGPIRALGRGLSDVLWAGRTPWKKI